MKLKYTLVAVLLLGRCGHKPKQATPDCFQLAGSLKQTREAEFTRDPVWVPCSPRAERFMNGKPEGGEGAMRVGRLFMVLILALSIAQGQTTGRLTVTVGKSLIIDSPVNIQRVSVANHELAESVLVTPKEVLINAKKAGETTVVIEQENGNRLVYDVTIRQPPGH